ncbi:chemotaxis protein CheW [Neptuniibacter sp. QD37_6]|uniref:chemotaxis protein CheW n=1 Tax=Neptuniibacter sp. QD37_6 TaxID=3398210 RepID=UPI0039F45A84
MDAQLTINIKADDQPSIHQIRHGFEIGSYQLLISELTRAEVVKAPSICLTPSTPDWFAGFMNHRGEMVPVYDLNRYLEILDGKTAPQSWVLLIDDHPKTVGVLLTQPPQSITDPVLLDQACGDLPDVIRQAAGQVYEHQDRHWVEIDHHRLFLALKKQF